MAEDGFSDSFFLKVITQKKNASNMKFSARTTVHFFVQAEAFSLLSSSKCPNLS